jgi:hypothetical protein
MVQTYNEQLCESLAEITALRAHVHCRILPCARIRVPARDICWNLALLEVPDLHGIDLLLQCDDPVPFLIEGVAKGALGGHESAAVGAAAFVVAVVGADRVAGVDVDGALFACVEGVRVLGCDVGVLDDVDFVVVACCFSRVDPAEKESVTFCVIAHWWRTYKAGHMPHPDTGRWAKSAMRRPLS